MSTKTSLTNNMDQAVQKGTLPDLLTRRRRDMPRTQLNGPVGFEMPPIKRLPRFAVSPYFLKEAEMKISTESPRMTSNFSPNLEVPLKSPVLETPVTPKRHHEAPPSTRFLNRNRFSMGSLSPLHETPSPRRSPSHSPGFKTFHAPKANLVYTVPKARTFGPNRIDTLIATLAEKLISLRARSDIIASNIDYASKLIREISVLDGRS